MTVRFALAVHILAYLEIMKPNKVTSELISKSIHTHPARVRQIYRLLGKAELIRTRQRGGTAIGRAADQITLLDVFRAVEEPDQRFLPVYTKPNEALGCGIRSALNQEFEKLDQKFRAALGEVTIAQVARHVPTSLSIQRKSD